MSGDFLKKIATEKTELLKARAGYYQTLKKNLSSSQRRPYEVFRKAISKPGRINLIAEVKKASPSAGLIRQDFEAISIAKVYANNGAAAISVLTEEKYFLGKMAYLKKISDEFGLPTLMKDFVVHEFQIFEGAFHGASAVLLIVAMLSRLQIQEFMDCAMQLGLDCLVEVHDERELEVAIGAKAQIIGINNRDLHTLEVDVSRCLQLIPKVPQGRVIVAESGLRARSDIAQVQQAGAHAVLIGEAFMRSANMAEKIKDVMGG